MAERSVYQENLDLKQARSEGSSGTLSATSSARKKSASSLLSLLELTPSGTAVLKEQAVAPSARTETSSLSSPLQERRHFIVISGELKNRIDAINEAFFAGGVANPIVVVEQVTYLMFIHDLDDMDNRKSQDCFLLGLPYESIFSGEKEIEGRTIDGTSLKWSVFREFPAERMYKTVSQFVFPFIKTLHSDNQSAFAKYLKDARLDIPTPILLADLVAKLDKVYELFDTLKETDKDIRGDTYEYLLSKLSQAARNGQFRTPRHIVNMIVEMMSPTPNDIIADPACGTGGFLMAAGEYLRKKHSSEIFMDPKKSRHFMNEMFHGYDMDSTMLRISAMNMMSHGVENPHIEYRDSLSDQNSDRDKYSLILANPPFKGTLNPEIVSKDLLQQCNSKKTELLFVSLMVNMLQIGGRCACIVPDGVLFGSSNAHKQLRKLLVDGNRLEAVISLPSGVFKPYASVRTAILVFVKTGHGGTDKVWFYDITADGFSLDDKRSPTDESDLPDLLRRFHQRNEEEKRARTEKSFMVSKQEIVDNGYDLSLNKYKQTSYKKQAYPASSEILAELASLEEQISQGLVELEEMI